MAEGKSILVVGAGVAGPVLCYWLEQYGYQPTLIERSQQLRSGGYAIDIRGIAVDVARQMGIYEQVCAQSTTIKTARYLDVAGRLIHEESGEHFGHREGEDVEIVRGDLLDTLMNQIKDVPCRFACHVVSLKQNEDGVDVKFNDGEVASFDLVICADGLHSHTRSLAFSSDACQLFDLGSYISIFSVPNYLKLKHGQWLCESNQKSISIWSDHDFNSALVGFMFRSGIQLKNIESLSEQKQVLQQTFHSFGWEAPKLLELLEGVDDLYFDSITQVKMPYWHQGRVALVGDAGYCASPLSGQGTSLALVGAYVLAGELQLAAGNHKMAFERYHDLMRPYVDKNQSLGEWVSHFYLVDENKSQEETEKRTQQIMEKMKDAAFGIELPKY